MSASKIKQVGIHGLIAMSQVVRIRIYGGFGAVALGMLVVPHQAQSANSISVFIVAHLAMILSVYFGTYVLNRLGRYNDQIAAWRESDTWDAGQVQAEYNDLRAVVTVHAATFWLGFLLFVAGMMSRWPWPAS